MYHGVDLNQKNKNNEASYVLNDGEMEKLQRAVELVIQKEGSIASIPEQLLTATFVRGVTNTEEIVQQKYLFQKCYKTIYKIEIFKPLLRLAVIATQGGHRYAAKFTQLWQKQLKIYADASSETVEHLHLTTDSALGVFVYKNTVYVGSKRTENEVCGTLMHELTHFLTDEIFDNYCRPYDGTDTNTKELINDICTSLKKDPTCPYIIKSIFDDYKECSWHNEFIVRILQYIVTQENSKGAFETLEKLHPKILPFP